jgi:hypothetical protein
VLFVLGLVFVPMLVFASRLAAAKRVGLLEYGALAMRYVQEFDAKMAARRSPSRPALRRERGPAVARRPRQLL